MPQGNIRSLLILGAITAVSVIAALAQPVHSQESSLSRDSDSWRDAQLATGSSRRLDVVTIDQPQRRQSCHMQMFKPDKIICSRAFGPSRTYVPREVLALILPGDNGLRIRLVLGLNVGLGAAIWGTVVLAATCPPCAAATGVAALLLFGAAGAVLYTDDQPDRLLYLAAGHQLTGKLRYIRRSDASSSVLNIQDAQRPTVGEIPGNAPVLSDLN